MNNLNKHNNNVGCYKSISLRLSPEINIQNDLDKNQVCILQFLLILILNLIFSVYI